MFGNIKPTGVSVISYLFSTYQSKVFYQLQLCGLIHVRPSIYEVFKLRSLYNEVAIVASSNVFSSLFMAFSLVYDNEYPLG